MTARRAVFADGRPVGATRRLGYESGTVGQYVAEPAEGAASVHATYGLARAAVIAAAPATADVRTWADGYGVWHAFTPTGTLYAATLARGAIRAEIVARQNGPIRPTRARWVRITAHGTEWVES